ncbi:hypothetical protein JCM8097_005254, partial [Rhodosporidiobolus ruineniae]
LLSSSRQIHLNHRLGTFAGGHRLAQVFDLTHSSLEIIPTALPGVFGLWEKRSPISWRQVLGLVLTGYQTWQAVTLPTVPQEEKDEEE